MPRRPRYPLVLAAILLALAVALTAHGVSFYRLPLDARVDHPDFQQLRPSGSLGNGLGYVAALLVLTNLLYLARRRHLFTLGSMRLWLDIHVFTGLLGGELAAFHTAFQLRSGLARLTAASLGVVVLTGLVGRFLHALVGVAQGRHLPPAVEAIEDKIPGLGPRVLAAAEAWPPTELPADASHLRCLATLPRWWREARARSEAVSLVARNDARVARARGAEAVELERLVRQAARAAAAEVRAVSRAAFLRSWRSLHRLFAILMLLAVAIHAGVAWHYGYRWIFE